ncbi:hypothetical protein [Salinicola sp. CR57]|uniref:hypothetical protein n=1 Tax=Salinicola sp. CR57 TaxID=1949086 RepID=UPI001E53942F|nr:hypothetical protein [Salinicola sp. CR57]
MTEQTHMIVLVQSQFEYRRIVERRNMMDVDGRIRLRPIPELHEGEVLAGKPGESIYRIIKHE